VADAVKTTVDSAMADTNPDDGGEGRSRRNDADYSGSGDWARGLSHGLEVAVGVGLGYLAGNWADRHFGIKPWGLLAGVLIGCAAGMYLLVKDAIRSDPPKKK
jgi:F0F1-type ATP synthase assembly protein I